MLFTSKYKIIHNDDGIYCVLTPKRQICYDYVTGNKNPQKIKEVFTLKKRFLSIAMALVLSISAAAAPSFCASEAYASANYGNAEIESYARQVAAIVNSERASNGLSPLKYSDELSEAALVRAREIQSAFSHTRPNGSSCFTAIKEAGISYTTAGENIAYGQRTPEEVMNSWMNSSGHRANILGSNYEYIGIGVTYKNGTYYWSQFFAASKDLTGEIITQNNSTATTKAPTTKATTAATKAPTTEATTATTKAPTTKATTAATKAPTTKATTAATKAPTTKATTATTKATQPSHSGSDKDQNNNKINYSRIIQFIRMLREKLGRNSGC